MRIVFVVLSFSAIVGLAACSKLTPGDSHAEADHETVKVTESSAKAYFTCPMHPSIVSDKPGACPICGMSLVKRSSQVNLTEGDLESLKGVSLSPSQRILANVSTSPARRRAFLHRIAAVGVVDYAEPFQAKVSARFRGRIERLHVNFTGEVVHKGQPLFELYSPDLVSAEREYVLALNSLAAVQGGDVDPAQKVQLGALANAASDRLRIHYGMTAGQIETIAASTHPATTVTFYSPIHGTVVSKEVQEGQYVDEGTLLYQLADLSKVWAYLDIYEKDVRFIKRGQTVAISADAYPDESFNGRVAFIDPVFDSQTRTTRVRVELENAGGRLRPQMYIKAEIQIPVASSIVVPAPALISTGKRDVVWIEVKDNVFEPRDVVTGVSDGTDVQILRGLNEGDLVATKGGFMLDSESQLQQPTNAEVVSGEPKESASRLETGKQQGVNERHLKILVNGEFVPNVLRMKLGETASLHFYREKESGCIEEVVFKSLGIRRHLKTLETTTIDITPAQKGEIPFTCGMEMVKGTLVVE